MDERVRATYRIWSDDVAAVAEAIRIEQTIEFPFDLAEKWIQDEVVGWIESVTDSAQGHSDVEISYDVRTVERTAPAHERPLGELFDASGRPANRRGPSTKPLSLV